MGLNKTKADAALTNICLYATSLDYYIQKIQMAKDVNFSWSKESAYTSLYIHDGIFFRRFGFQKLF